MDQFTTAFHEASHAFFFKKYFPQIQLTLEIGGDGRSNGRCIVEHQFDLLYRTYSDNDLIHDTMQALAGDAAESILSERDHPNPEGFNQDMIEARRRIDRAFVQHGLSTNMKNRIGLNQEKYEAECFELAKRLVRENIAAIRIIANELLSKGSLTNQEIETLLRNASIA